MIDPEGSSLLMHDVSPSPSSLAWRFCCESALLLLSILPACRASASETTIVTGCGVAVVAAPSAGTDTGGNSTAAVVMVTSGVVKEAEAVVLCELGGVVVVLLLRSWC